MRTQVEKGSSREEKQEARFYSCKLVSPIVGQFGLWDRRSFQADVNDRLIREEQTVTMQWTRCYRLFTRITTRALVSTDRHNSLFEPIENIRTVSCSQRTGASA